MTAEPDPPVLPTAAPDRDAGGRGRQWLGLLSLALLAAAAALAGAARLPWFTARVDAVGRGAVPVTATGADLVGALSAVALLALAAVAAAVALAGPARRVLGGLVAAAGVGVGVAVAGLLLTPPTPADLAALPGAPAGGTAVAGSVTGHLGPAVAALGAVLLVAAGVVLLVGEGRLPRLGARYARRAAPEPADPARAAGRDRPAAPDRADPGHVADPDRAAWDALDAGLDPTADGIRPVRAPAAPSAAGAPSPPCPPSLGDSPARPGRTDDGPPGRAV